MKEDFNFNHEPRNWTVPPELSGDDLLPANTFEGYFNSRYDETKICFAFSVPDNATGNTVVIEQGTAEHVGKYADTFHELNRRGISVFFAEPRGQGMSERKYPQDPRKMSGWDFKVHADDCLQMLEDVVLPVMDCHGFSNPQITGAGFSQGATRLLHTHYHYPDFYQRLIIGAPMIHQKDMVRLYENMERRPEKTMAYLKKRFGVNSLEDTIPSDFEIENEEFARTSDELPALWHRYNGPDDETCLRANKATLDFIRHGGAACIAVQDPEFVASIKVPVLTFIAEEKIGLWHWGDTCVDNERTKEFVKNLPHATLVTLRPSGHDALKESPEQREFIFDVVCNQFSADPDGFIQRNNAAQQQGPTQSFLSAINPWKEREPSATQTQSTPATPPQSESERPAPEPVSA